MATRTTPRRNSKDGVTFVARSPIHGRGVYAYREILADEWIGTFKGVPVKRDGHYVLWVDRGNGKFSALEGRNHLRFVNHSSDPNAEFDGVELYALRAIAPEEEITIDYGDDWANDA